LTSNADAADANEANVANYPTISESIS